VNTTCRYSNSQHARAYLHTLWVRQPQDAVIPLAKDMQRRGALMTIDLYRGIVCAGGGGWFTKAV